LSDLNSLQSGSLDLILQTDSHAVIGSQVCIKNIIKSNTLDANNSNDTLSQCFTIRNSYDPNLKEVSPTKAVRDGEWLTYTIHFQNTGNDTAYTVIVQDTLDANIDAASFQYLASSHHAVIQLFDHATVFTFPKINLVDSATNPALSQGWIQYRVKSKTTLPIGTQIQNRASIYFDLNSPIVTNTVINSVTNIICIASHDTINKQICDLDSFNWGGIYFKKVRLYTNTFVNIQGCDSIVTLNLSVKPTYHDTISRSMCASDSIFFGGVSYHAAGTYSHTFTSTSGYDSIITLYLTVKSIKRDTITQPICQGDSALFAGVFYHSSGLYTHTFIGSNGCDSFVTFHLIVNPLVTDTITRSICMGDTLHIASHHYTNTGTYTDTLHAISGCDSIVTLQLTVKPTYHDTITRSICMGDTLHIGSHAYTTSGIYAVILTNSVGCDSLVIVNLSVSTCTGIHEVSGSPTLRLYPNPNSGSFTLETTGAVGSEYHIYDMLGQVIRQGAITTSRQYIDLDNTPSGIYTLVISSTSGAVRLTVVH
jgi:uncharacterized repeat protein (TIGR01451 family)